ncbi:MAG: antibiotic biosynthesis monooxygenase [Acidobacteria bacterium]|nr:antibiotic biosynthesis monooxygenase [Acidobacteriota bacterium]
MIAILVHVHVRPDDVDAFVQASLDNARNSREEPGVVRFDVLQREDDRCRFMLVEVYRTSEDPARHKATAHYARWRDAVEPMMAEPRTGLRYADLSAELGQTGQV